MLCFSAHMSPTSCIAPTSRAPMPTPAGSCMQLPTSDITGPSHGRATGCAGRPAAPPGQATTSSPAAARNRETGTSREGESCSELLY